MVLSLPGDENILVLDCQLDRQAFERFLIKLIFRFILWLSDRIGLYALCLVKHVIITIIIIIVAVAPLSTFCLNALFEYLSL